LLILKRIDKLLTNCFSDILSWISNKKSDILNVKTIDKGCTFKIDANYINLQLQNGGKKYT